MGAACFTGGGQKDPSVIKHPPNHNLMKNATDQRNADLMDFLMEPETEMDAGPTLLKLKEE